MRDSASGNGFHIKYRISESKSDIIRLVFDDQRRFMADFAEKDDSTRNVLWDVKKYRKGSHSIECKAGSWFRLASLYNPRWRNIRYGES